MLVASRSMETEDFAQLRKEARQTKDDLTFLKEEADSYLGEMARQQQQALQAQAQECVKVLQDEIPEWSNELYNDIHAYFNRVCCLKSRSIPTWTSSYTGVA